MIKDQHSTQIIVKRRLTKKTMEYPNISSRISSEFVYTLIQVHVFKQFVPINKDFRSQ